MPFKSQRSRQAFYLRTVGGLGARTGLGAGTLTGFGFTGFTAGGFGAGLGAETFGCFGAGVALGAFGAGVAFGAGTLVAFGAAFGCALGAATGFGAGVTFGLADETGTEGTVLAVFGFGVAFATAVLGATGFGAAVSDVGLVADVGAGRSPVVVFDTGVAGVVDTFGVTAATDFVGAGTRVAPVVGAMRFCTTGCCCGRFNAANIAV